MEKQEKIREIAKKHARIRLVPCYGLKGEFERYEEASSEMDCLYAAREMAEWQEKQVIEKACEWLKDDMLHQNAFQGRWARLEIIDGIIERFKKAMLA